MSKLQVYQPDMTVWILLKQAVQALGWSIRENAPVQYYYGQGEVCTYVLEFGPDVLNDHGEQLQGKYSIGVNVEKGRITGMLHDNAMNSREVKAQNEQDSCTQRVLGILKQAYQVQAINTVAKAKGWKLIEQQAQTVQQRKGA